MITVAVIDDHPLVRAGMKTVLNASPDIAVIAEGKRGGGALSLVREYQPNVLVLDINLPDINGLEVTRQLAEAGTPCAILIVTALDDAQLIFKLLECGAVGYVLKDDVLEALPHAVRAAARGESWLSPAVASKVVQRAVQQERDTTAVVEESSQTEVHLTPREREILKLLAQGLDNATIAERLVITKRTVQNHISNIYGKLGVTSRTEAMLYAIKQRWGGWEKNSP